MKQKLLTAGLIALAFFQSCSDDDKGTPSLSGRFGMVSYETYNCSDATKNKVTQCPSTIHCRDLEFLADGKLNIHYSTVTHPGTYVIAQNQLVLEDNYYNSGVSTLYTIAVDGNKITLTRQDEATGTACMEKEIYNKL